MRKLWIRLNILYERLVLFALAILVLIGLYAMYDMYYVFEHAGNNDLLKYKPTTAGYDAAASPITEDMVCWVTINDTNIDYPVMQGEDNTKYLNTDPYGQYSLSGSIFLDSRNNAEMTDFYSILYGHHMEYGKMFGALDDFLDPNYLASHSTGTLIVGRDGHKTYNLKLFAAVKGSARDKRLFDTSNDKSIIDYIKTRATVFNEAKPNRILVLSTCSEDSSVARVLVFAYILE